MSKDTAKRASALGHLCYVVPDRRHFLDTQPAVIGKLASAGLI